MNAQLRLPRALLQPLDGQWPGGPWVTLSSVVPKTGNWIYGLLAMMSVGWGCVAPGPLPGFGPADPMTASWVV